MSFSDLEKTEEGTGLETVGIKSSLKCELPVRCPSTDIKLDKIWGEV